jgi:death-on-curing protein
MRYLTAEELLLIHYKLIERYGGSHGVRDIKRLASAAVAPVQEVFGAQQYPDIWQKAAVYARNIIADHPFTDGNKRTGMTAAAMFLKRNGYEFSTKPGELEDFAVKIATEHPDVQPIAAWFKAHANPR